MSLNTKSINPGELQKHSSSSSCWIIVDKKVWDITSFLGSHPGGPEIILQYAGNDATTAYNEVHAPSIISTTLSPDKLVGHITDEDLASLPKIDKPTASPDQPLPALESKSIRKLYTKPPLEAILNAYDFEEVCSRTVSEKAKAFYMSAATDLITHRLNSKIYSKVLFRPRVLRPVRDTDTSSSILGIPMSLPVFVSPAAMARLAHPDGELALARGAKAEGILQVISTNASYPLREIVESVSSPSSPHPWFLQLYVNTNRKQTEDLLVEAVKLGVRGIFLTVDCPVAGKREADERLAHDVSMKAPISGGGSQKPSDSKGGGLARMMGLYIDSNLQWSDIPWIANSLIRGQQAAGSKTDKQIPIVIKGIQTAVDAKLALKYAKYGVKGVYLSNHGGRSLDTSPPAILTLLECWKVCPEIFEKLEVYIDGGIHRGTDVVKALALGATAVGVGRPFLYSLVYGKDGVRKLVNSKFRSRSKSKLTILLVFQDEVKVTMQMLGINNIGQLHPGLINTRGIDHLVSDTNDYLGDDPRHPYAGRRKSLSKL